MKKGLTELVFILDKSGSMSGLEKDTIGGYNSIDIKAASPITEREYQVGGSTALIDAMGRTIDKIGNAQKDTAEAYRAEKVLFVIITDGEENASREYSSRKVKAMVERQKSKYGWECIFLGANIDAVETAAHFGVGADRAQSYHSDSAGTELNYRVVSEAVVTFRETAAMSKAWNVETAEDFKTRGGESKD